jgi:hypothetical protein
MEIDVPPQWKDSRYESLSPEVQKLYDAYVEAYEKSRDLGQKLLVAATSEWLARHPNGIDGKFISFNANGGRLRWVLATKRPSGNYKTVGEDVPSAEAIKQTEAEIKTDEPAIPLRTKYIGSIPEKIRVQIRVMAQKNWGELVKSDQLGLIAQGVKEESWSGMSLAERESKFERALRRKPPEANKK